MSRTPGCPGRLATRRPAMSRAVLLAAAGSTALSPVHSLAEEGAPRAAVITVPSRSASAARASEVLAPLVDALDRRLQLIGPADAVARLQGPDPGQRMRDAAEDAAEARAVMRAFDDLDLAAELLENAAERVLTLLPLLETIEEPLGLLRDLATVYLALDRRDRVEAALAESARLDPDLPVDESLDPSRLVNAAHGVREERVRALSILNPNIATRLARLLGVERLAVCRIEGAGRLRLEVYEGQAGRRTARLDVGTDDAASLAPRLARDLALEVPGETAAPEDETPWYRSWWFITTLVVGVAVATIVTLVAVNAAQD